MPIFGPQGATALAAGFNGQDLAAQLLQKQLQNRGTQMDLQEARRAQLGRMLLEDAVKNVMGKSGEMPMPKAPAKTTKAGEIKVEPVAPLTAEGTTMPGGAAPVTAPAGGGIAPAGAPAASPPGSVTQPGTPEPAQAAAPPSQARKQFTWRDVLQDVMQREDVEPGAKFYAQQEIQKQIDAEDQRTFKADESRLQRAAVLQRHYDNLKLAYDREQNGMMKSQLDREMRQTLAELNATNRETLARIGAQNRIDVAGMNNASRMKMNEAKLLSNEQLAANKLEYQKQFDKENLDLKADSQAKNFMLKTRELDLRDKGLNNEQARFVAKLEQDMTIAKMRDETTKRGQDLTLERAQLAQQGKLRAEEAKVAAAMPRVLDNFDAVQKAADDLLNEPGLESATGPIQSWLPTVRDDTADFEAKLTLLKSLVGFQALADMRAASPTGGALGNVSNKEVEFLQNTMAALSLSQSADQFRESLMAIRDKANLGKARTLQAYETRFGGKATGGDISTAATAPKAGGETRALPPDLAGEPNGTVVKDGKKTFMIQDGKLVETGQ